MRTSNAARWRPGGSRDNVFLTPAYILEAVRAIFGAAIGLDPCTEPDNPTRAERWYALPVDGLQQPWDAATIYVNPPYGEARRPWIRRCLELGQARRAAILLLVPADTDTALGQAVITGADAVLFVAGRLDFGTVRPNGTKWRATHASMLAGWGVDLGRAAHLGTVLRP